MRSRNSLTNLRNFSIIKSPTRLQNYTRGCEKNCLTSSDRFRVQNARREKALRNDPNIIILPADKGRTTAIMDKTDYSKELLQDNKTYKKLDKKSSQNNDNPHQQET